MRTRWRSECITSFMMVLTLVFFTACQTLSSYETAEKRPDSVTKPEEKEGATAATPQATVSVKAEDGMGASPAKDKDPLSAPATTQPNAMERENGEDMTTEELLDSALEYCETAKDFWERGDLDSAIEALDKAYALMLKVEADDNANLIQQKEDLRLTISKRIVEVYASRYTVATGVSKAIPLSMNHHVRRELESFKTRERDFFMNAYRRSGRYRPAIVRALREAGFPEELSWLPLIESGFKVRALSSARALGMWQFIASTGYRFGLKRDSWIDERMDFEKSTEAAIAYLRELHQIFGDWTTALAAYNCGEYAVLNRIKTQRINYLDNFWDLYEKLPNETAAYVPRFMAVLHLVNDPAAHGMSLPPLEMEVEWEEVTVNKQVQLKTIAELLNVPQEELEEMNAELRQNLTPDAPYSLKVPAGKGEIILAKIDSIPAWCPPASTSFVHKVKKGETLKSIGTRYKVFPEDIAALNNLKMDERLKRGMKLRIPAKKGTSVSKTAKASTQGVAKAETPNKYKVKKGDSLYYIANRFNTTATEIQEYNGLKSASLHMGQVLVIPPVSKENCPPEKTKSYTVKEGDTPYHIAQRHQMHLSEFLKLNSLAPHSTIFPGQELLVRAQ